MSPVSKLKDLVPPEIDARVASALPNDLIGTDYPFRTKMRRKQYEAEKRSLQIELLKLQKWVKESGQKVIMIFEGRDAAGKGGTIKRFMEHINPRGARVVALGVPTETERGQWYFQRYIQQLPTAGEIVLFDRSWYNRAVIEPVMGFCTETQYKEFLDQVHVVERSLVESGTHLFKFWFSVSREEQYRRFKKRDNDPLRRWKLSPVDQEVLGKWDEVTAYKNVMLKRTHRLYAPWTIVRSDGKKRARLNTIRHVLHELPYTFKDTEVAAPPDARLVGTPTQMYKNFGK
jgi:polyphosphate kinase 2